MNEFEVNETEIVATGGGSRWIVWAATAAMAAVLVVGAVFVVNRANSQADGAASPEELADNLIEALNNEDALAVVELVAPAERRTLLEPMIDASAELSRLGILSDDLDLGALSGIDIQIVDAEYEIGLVPGADDIRNLTFTAGTTTVTGSGAELPLGDLVQERFGDMLADETIDEVDPLAGDHAATLIEIDGRWYLSLWHSIADAGRMDMADGTLVPSPAESPAALGSATPEAAVEGMLNSLVDLDIAAAIGHIDPDEAAALYRYSPLFLADAQDELDALLDEVRSEGATWELRDLGFSSELSGDDGVVTIESFTVAAQAEGMSASLTYTTDQLRVMVNGEGMNVDVTLGFNGDSLDIDVVYDDGWDAFEASGTLTTLDTGFELSGTINGESIDASVDFDGECTQYSLRMGETNEIGCVEDLLWEMGVGLDLNEMGVTPEMMDQRGEFTLPGVPVAVHRTDGEWFVSPTTSMMNQFNAWLESVERSDVEDMLDFFVMGFEGTVELPM